jgi:hypothetical protein
MEQVRQEIELAYVLRPEAERDIQRSMPKPEDR